MSASDGLVRRVGLPLPLCRLDFLTGLLLLSGSAQLTRTVDGEGGPPSDEPDVDVASSLLTALRRAAVGRRDGRRTAICCARERAALFARPLHAHASSTMHIARRAKPPRKRYLASGERSFQDDSGIGGGGGGVSGGGGVNGGSGMTGGLGGSGGGG